MSRRSPLLFLPVASDTKPEAGVEREATPDTAPPAPAAPAAADDPAVTKALRGISEDPATLFATARADLNGDGAMELLVYPYGPGICGTGGCNLIVLTPDGMLNQTGLRFRDEFVRHKILDIIGDLALLGMPIMGKVVAERSGHIMHAGLMSKLLRVRSAWDIIDMPTTRSAQYHAL